MKNNILYSTFLLIFLFSSCSSDDTPPEPVALEAVALVDQPYGEDAQQQFDIYLPANRNKTDTPVLILIHGGGWTSGDKGDMNGFMDLLRAELPDVAIVNMNYRLANHTTPVHPTQVNDISSLVALLGDRRSEYHISDRLGFIGVSAGAHLSLLWSYAYDTGRQTKMVCSIVGPTNLKDEAYINNADPALQELLDLYGGDLAFLETVSPLFQATSASPPTILFYGGQDPLIPTSQGTDMRDRLEALGVTHEFTLYPEEGHGWTGTNLLDTWTKLKAFIGTHL